MFDPGLFFRLVQQVVAMEPISYARFVQPGQATRTNKSNLGQGASHRRVLGVLAHVPMQVAIGASLISVVATSAGASVAFVRDGWTNLRVAIILECATVTGALAGAYLAGIIPVTILELLFALMMLQSAYFSLSRHGDEIIPASDPLCARLRLGSEVVTDDGVTVPYGVANLPAGAALMVVAGLMSGLLGVGAGALKVVAMDYLMHLPLKVFVDALISLCLRMERQGAVRVLRELEGGLPPLSSEVELVIYRVAQEALTNALRHSGASQARVALGPASEGVALTIADNGRGLPRPMPAETSGLAGMRERAILIGAALEIVSSPDGGVEVHLRVASKDAGASAEDAPEMRQTRS